VESRFNQTPPSTLYIRMIGEAVTMKQGEFFRPKGRRETTGQGTFQKILKKVLRIALQLLLVSFFLFMGHWFYVHLLADPFFRVREVEVEGYRKISRETLLSLITIEGMPNLFTVRLKEIAKRVESHPWIDHVKVRKIFPNKILIQVEERKPIAILQLEELYYIDQQGVIFSRAGDRDEYNYPFLTGLTRDVLEKDPAAATRLITKALELLRAADKEKTSPLEEISEVHMEKGFGVQCFTQNEGLEVRMGWDHFGEKLKRLSLIWSDLRKRGWSATSIDCSDLERMVVKRIMRREK
jgi:cell division septal protein FtsQ